MVQNINLLSKRKARKGLLSLALLALGLWVLVLAVLATTTEWNLQQQRQAQTKTRESVNTLKLLLDKKRQELGLDNSEAMAKQVALLRSQLDAKREWADLQQKGELGNPSGYSQWLETLAAVHVDGVWLQGLDIAKGGQSVSIRGKSLHADAVMRYIEQVNEAFKPMGVRFTSMEITQDAAADAGAARQVATLSFKIF